MRHINNAPPVFLSKAQHPSAGTQSIAERNTIIRMNTAPFSATGASFEIHEWRGSGPATLHVHHSDDEAWHILEGELTFRYIDRSETAGPGSTVFVPAGVAHTYTAAPDTRYLIVLTPRLSALIKTLQSDRDPTHQNEIYQRFNSELLE
jgi:mannose-6-phosphate isomerase-like protein (cupin superfamily)